MSLALRRTDAPEGPQPATGAEIQELGDAYWALQAYRELDDALLHLRVNEPLIGLVCLRTKGDAESVLSVDQTLLSNWDHWLVREIVLYMARVLRRLDLTAKSFFAIVEPGSCFAGNLLELLLLVILHRRELLFEHFSHSVVRAIVRLQLRLQ